ncbi:MAG: hypothetical protein JXR84_02855 [Anaerolineae bacterium]|nr:hypothetical protein [Anaerolineae bacterium]
MNEPTTGVDDAPVDVSVARKLLDEPLAVQQVDLPDFFPALSRRTELDVMVGNVTTQWVEAGCALDAAP